MADSEGNAPGKLASFTEISGSITMHTDPDGWHMCVVLCNELPVGGIAKAECCAGRDEPCGRRIWDAPAEVS